MKEDKYKADMLRLVEQNMGKPANLFCGDQRTMVTTSILHKIHFNQIKLGWIKRVEILIQ